MPFITQGKTNWKFLLIVIILSVIVGGGVLWCSMKQKVLPIQLLELKKSEQVVLSYKDVLTQMFPENEFSEVKERSDCFQDQEDIFYCIESVKKDFLTESNQKNILVVIREGYNLGEDGLPWFPHAAGFYHVLISVFDKDTKKILTESKRLIADDGTINFYDCNGRTYVLFTGSSGGQGWCSGTTSLLQIEDKKFIEIWPLSKEEWSDIILEPQENKASVYKREGVGPDFVCPTKCICEAPEIIGQAFVYSYDLNWNNKTCKFEEQYGIFGDSEFDTIVSGYLETKKKKTIDGLKIIPYFVITKFYSDKFRESIEEGINSGNGVNIKENGLYKFNLGCLENGKIIGIEYEKNKAYIDGETTTNIINSSKENPVSIILSFGKHLGSECSCCNLANQVRIYP